MHLHFEKNTNTKCDCTILSLSWMGKVPDELPEDEGWKLNRTNYYQEGWLATGNVRGIVGVTYTTSHCNKALEYPPRTNYNLRGHRSEVILVKWNEPYQKLASCDSSGVIFVWIKYEGRWSIELINDRNTRVTHFSWSHDGRMALICYQDGFVLVGSVAGQRYWSSMLNLDCTINCGIWTPNDQLVYFGTSNGQLVVMDVHGAMMAQVEIANQVAVTAMAWSCEKFKMEETDDSNDSCLCAKYVLAVSLENGTVMLMKHYYDVSPISIQTGLCPLCIEWSNSKQLLAVAGTIAHTEFTNMIKVYTDSGNLLYTSLIPNTMSAVTAMTWGHNDKRLFIATGCIVHMAWVSMRIASLQLLSSLQVYNRLQGGVQQIPSLPLPLRIQHRLSKLFAHTIRCCVPEGSGLREFVSKSPKVRLHCTMLRHDEDISANCYTLFLEYLGGLVPLLKGKRTSKLKPEFVIFDPQVADCQCVANGSITINAGCSGSEREDSECEDLYSSPRLSRKKNRHHPRKEILYADTLPEESHLAEVTSNIWGTKFRIRGIASCLAVNLGQVTYKTSLLHLQPRQMTLLMAGDGPSEPGVSQVLSDDEDEGKGLEDGGAVAVAPLMTRCRAPTGYQGGNGNNIDNKMSRAEWFMTRSSFRDCECPPAEGALVGGHSNSEESRRGVVRSCSVGYLDLVEGAGSNNRLVLVRQGRPVKLTHAGKSRSLDSSDIGKGIAGTGVPQHPPPSSSPASPAMAKKKRNPTSSPIRVRILNSPLLPRRLRPRRTDTDGYQDLESFQKAQLRNKIETTAKRKEFIMHNKAPMWNENSQVYQLDFGGRVTQESAKNFQVEFRGKQIVKEKDQNSQESIICECKPYYKKPCFFFTVSLFLCSLTSFIILIGTELYDTAILKIITLQEGGTVFDIWKELDCETTIYIYPFNYSNIENIKTERPHVQELGPYVFKEKVQKVNIVFNENGTLTFSENRTHWFDPSSSIGDLDDFLYTPNIPFMSAAAQGAEKGMITQFALAAFLKGLDTRLFLPVTISEFVDGFDDSFSIVARKLASILKGVSPPTFGMLADRIGLSPDRVTMGTGKPDLDTFGIISAYNGESSLDFWNTEECNTITGSDGTFFPAKEVQTKSSVYVYLPRLCRRIPLVYNGINQVINDFPTKRFEMPHNVFSTPEENPDNACFCEGKKCPPSGTFSTSKCSFSAPLSVSYPHFLHSDEELRTNVTGLNPDLEKHSFFLDLHSRFGVTMGGRMRFQLNVVVHHCPFLLQLRAIPDRTVLPIAWIDVSPGQMKGFGKDVIYHATYTVYYIKEASMWTSFVIMLLTFLRIYFLLIKSQ